MLKENIIRAKNDTYYFVQPIYYLAISQTGLQYVMGIKNA